MDSLMVLYSIEYGQPFFQYRDGKRHIVWYEDSRARARKLQMMIDYRLRGIGAWQLGLHFPHSAIVVRGFLSIKKII
jgi:spore germination protein